MLPLNVLEDFQKKNEVWKEILVLLGERIEALMAVMESCPKESIWGRDQDGKLSCVRGIEFYQGAIEEVRELMNAPEILIQEAKDKLKGKEE